MFAMAADLEPTLASRVKSVASDHVSGASVLTRQAIDILTEACLCDRATVDTVACALCAAQPAMAPVWNVAALAAGADGLNGVQNFTVQFERSPSALARVLRRLLMMGRNGPGHDVGPMVIATVSASKSVQFCLKVLAKTTELHVVCTEARPLLEGRRMAADLAHSGISTTVCTDAGIGAVVEASMPQLEAVIVGADAVAPRWFINKCGTRQLVTTAASLGVPAYVVASRDKFINSILAAELRPNEGPPEEIWDAAPLGVTVANPYFERVPIDSAAMFITDVGAVGPGSVPDLCQSIVNVSDSTHLVEMVRRNLDDHNPQ